MNKPHKYAEVIKAWADGKDVQYKHEDEEKWTDYVDGNGLGFQHPNFLWRIKPEPKKAGDVLYDCYKNAAQEFLGQRSVDKSIWQASAEAFIRELKAGNIKED